MRRAPLGMVALDLTVKEAAGLHLAAELLVKSLDDYPAHAAQQVIISRAMAAVERALQQTGCRRGDDGGWVA